MWCVCGVQQRVEQRRSYGACHYLEDEGEERTDVVSGIGSGFGPGQVGQGWA